MFTISMCLFLIPLAITEQADTKATTIPYRLTDTNHVLVRVKINNKGPYNFILDTGAPAVFIPGSLAKSLTISSDRSGWVQFDSFELEGGLVVPNTRSRIEDLYQLQGMNSLGLAGVELHGVIGYEVLAKYRITYDFTKDKLEWVPLDFEPPSLVGFRNRGAGQGGMEMLGPVMKFLSSFMGIRPDFGVEPRGFLGIDLFTVDDKVIIKSVLNNSPAAKAKLKAGDQIVAASIESNGRNKQSVTVKNMGDLVRILDRAMIGDTFAMIVQRDGKTLELKGHFGGGL